MTKLNTTSADFANLTAAQKRICCELSLGGQLLEPGLGEKSYRLLPNGCEPSYDGKLVRAATIDFLETNGFLTSSRDEAHRCTTDEERHEIVARITAHNAWLDSGPVTVCPT